MLYVNNDGSIQLTRGDTARLSVNVNNEVTDSSYEIADGDILKMTVKKSVNDKDYCFQKSVEGANTFHIEPKDTKSMSFGKYLYDVQLTTEDGDVYTVIGPTTFEILKEITC